MDITKFSAIFEPVKAKIAQLDALAAQGGKHWNESQLEQAVALTNDFREVAEDAFDDASDFLHVEDSEQPTSDAPNVTEVMAISDLTKEVFDGMSEGDQVRVIEGGSTWTKRGDTLIEGTNDPAKDAAAAAALGENHPITQGAIASLKAGDRSRSTGGQAGVTTDQTGTVVDKPGAGDEIELSTSAGATQTAHTDDQSRVIQEAGTDPAKVLLDTNFSADNNASANLTAGTNVVTGSPTADAPADVAAATNVQGSQTGAVIQAVIPEADPTPNSAASPQQADGEEIDQKGGANA